MPPDRKCRQHRQPVQSPARGDSCVSNGLPWPKKYSSQLPTWFRSDHLRFATIKWVCTVMHSIHMHKHVIYMCIYIYVKIYDLTLKVKVSKWKRRKATLTETRRFHHPRPGRQVCSARSGRASRDALHEPRVTVTSGEKLRVPGRVESGSLKNTCVITV